MSELVTIATFYESRQALLARAALEGSGITCFLLNEHLGAAVPLYNMMTEGIGIQVFREDAEAALEILNLAPAAAPPLCPRCGKEGRDITPRWKRLVLAFLFLLLPMSHVRTAYRCVNCRFVWK